MITWNKKAVTKNDIDPLCQKYGIDPILASIFVRRNIREGNDLLYFLEDDLRFQHEPYLLPNMEDAVERILQAEEENEKILIFGDRDVDGITSTSILYGYLKKRGIDVQWKLPLADDAYGLSITAVEEFAAQEGTLIITVDCGISNNAEVERANDLGIDVIITDHHNPPENLPNAIIIIDPKLKDSEYPFPDISGAAVAYKLVSALRFAHSDFYNSEITLLDITEDAVNNCYNVDCVKTRNLVKVKELHEKIIPGRTSIYDLKLPYFLQSQLIYVWDAAKTSSTLKDIFGSGVQFNLNDLKSLVSQMIPALKTKTASELVQLSRMAKYIDEENSVMNSMYNLYVTYCKRTIYQNKPEMASEEKKDLQLVALAALADIMPMKNENRVLVTNGINSMKKDRPRPGLAELFSVLKLNVETITSTDLSWNITPALNSPRRLGQPDIALQLLISEDAKEREMLAQKICALNEERKNIVQNAFYQLYDQAKQSIEEYDNKLCIVVCENLYHGLGGLISNKLMQDFGVPAIAITFCNDVCIGSIRSNRNLIATDFLNSFGDFFLNHGGHNFAAGFNFEKSKLNEFLHKAKLLIKDITLSDESTALEVDAEIPPDYLTPDVFKILDTFEPYGAENPELVFISKNMRISDTRVFGNKEPSHLKLTFDCGKHKYPAIFWKQGERVRKDISIGKNCDILYTMSKNYYNGIETKQLILKEIQS